MPNLVLTKIDGNLGLIVLNNPKHNILSSQVFQDLQRVFNELRGYANVKAIVFASGSEIVFSTGADLREIARLSISNNYIKGMTVLSQLHAFFQEIANCVKPTVAAINGLCLGGGLELSLACRHRVASGRANFGLPEVSAGIIPGLGGTQRLPRLVGLQDALKIILTGRDRLVTAKQAVDIGLIDELIDGDFVAGAKKFVQRAISGEAPKRTVVIERQLAVEDYQEFESISSNKPGQAIRYAKAAVLMGIDKSLSASLGIEQQIFLDLLFHKETRQRFKAMARKAIWEKCKNKFNAVLKCLRIKKQKTPT